jgi:hypothetical protein
VETPLIGFAFDVIALTISNVKQIQKGGSTQSASNKIKHVMTFAGNQKAITPLRHYAITAVML